MSLAHRYTTEMVPKMSTAELQLAVKQLAGVDAKTRNTPSLRKRVLALIAKVTIPAEARADAAPATARAMAGDAGPPELTRLLSMPAPVAAKRAAKPKAAPPLKPAKAKPPAFVHDHRVLASYKIGDAIEKRDSKGTLIARVTVERDGFGWHGKVYESLTPIATEVSGTAQSGLVYFGVIPYNDRDRKGKTTADIAPAFDAALAVFNLVAKGLGLDTIDVRGLQALEVAEDHEAVRQAVARLRSYATQMRQQLQALALGENLLEVWHGRAPEGK